MGVIGISSIANTYLLEMMTSFSTKMFLVVLLGVVGVNAAAVSNRTARSTEGDDDVIFTFENHCPQTLLMGAQGRSDSRPSFVFHGRNYFAPNKGGWELKAGRKNSVYVPHDFKSGRFWARTGCEGTVGRNFHCETGNCGPWIECSWDNVHRGGAPPATLAEFTLNGFGNQDYYDVSLVDGFNVPLKIQVNTPTEGNPVNYWCKNPECAVDINQVCPSELEVRNKGDEVVACKSACEQFNTDEYCCRPPCCGKPETCTSDKWDVNYPGLVKGHCPTAYSYAYNDKTSTFFCRNTDYTIILCP